MNNDYLSHSKLLKRGWTKKQIESILGPPDKLGDNPVPGQPPVRLYLWNRVVEAEKNVPHKDPGFQIRSLGRLAETRTVPQGDSRRCSLRERRPLG